MSCEKSYFISWILRLLLFDVKFIYGLNVCRGDLITNVSLSTELQSEVLLPCSFESGLLKSNRTNESCVVWTHLTTDFVEISLDGETKFWNNRRGRIKAFPKLPESDFSIRICNVQQSDLGVYHCKLFRETNCFLAYKIIDLHKGSDSAVVLVDSLTWLIPAGSAVGAVVLLVLLIIACKFFKCQKKNSRQPVYENTSSHRAKFTNEGKNTSSHRAKFTNEGKEFEQGESKSSTDTVMSYWPFIAGGATIIIFLLVVMVCCIVYKQNKTSDQPNYANIQQVQDASKDQIIYENDQELRKKNSKRKRQFSSVYINRPENKVAIYVNSAAQEEETYANCTDNDYENVE